MHENLVHPEDAFLLVIDVQERYRTVLEDWDGVAARVRILIQGARLLELPIAYTEQYPKGLGSTGPEILETLEDAPRFEKRTISARGAPALSAYLEQLGRREGIVCGLETHACINQTVHSLLANGYRVHLPFDALASRHAVDHEQGYRKMLASGAIGGSVETILLECLRSADHPAFKPVQELLK